MSFDWLDKRPVHAHGHKQQLHAATSELADRAATMFRLGFTEKQAAQRLAARVAWEYDPGAKHGPYKRPEQLSDAAIGKIVADTYARRPG